MTSQLCRTLLVVAVAAGSALPTIASARAETIDMTAEYEAASRRASRNDISGAIRGFKLVVANDPLWSDAVYNVAALSEHIGQAADCALYFRRYLVLDALTDEADAIRARIAACEAAIPGAGTLVVGPTTPDGAAIAVDGLVLGQGTLGPIALPAGTYQITAERRDWEPFAESVTIAEGQQATLAVTLQPIVYYGAVRLEVVQPGATITVDGAEVGTSPLAEPLRLAAGTYLIEVRAPGYHAWRRAVEVRRDDDQLHRVELIDARIDLDTL